jgi:HEAT repeat protein
MNHTDPAIRAATLRAESGVHADPDLLLQEFLDDEDETVRATALVGLVTAGTLGELEGQEAIAKLEKDASVAERIALARAIQHQPHPVFNPVLLRLAEDPHDEVKLEVARAMDEAADPAFLPVLLEMLDERRLRETARRALVRMGEEALVFLGRALRDPRVPLRIRRQIPRTISRFGGELAAEILLERYPEEPDGMLRYKILRGLGRMRTDDPEIGLDESILGRATRETVEVIARLLRWRLDLEVGARRAPRRATPTQELLVQMLRDKEIRATERLFRLLGLQYGLEDMYSIYRGLRSGKREVRAGSRELLEHLVPPPLRDAVLSLIDDLPGAERLAGARPYHRLEPRDYRHTLAEMLGGRSPSLAALAAYHAGELGMVELEPSILGLMDGAPPVLHEVLQRARQLLDSPQTERLSYE